MRFLVKTLSCTRWLPLLLLACLASESALGQGQSPEFWQSQNIYQIITDRFYDGAPSNNNLEGNYNPSGSSGTSVHGGDFKGLEQKLDYIQALGATAIWISPIVLNANGEFHGYAGRDFYSVAPHWGTLADLQHFTSAAHARGMLVIQDIIVNHGGDLIYSTDSGYGSTFRYPPAGYNLRYRSSKQFAAPFNTNAANPSLTNLFHNNAGGIFNYSDSTQVELGELAGLDDFRTESTYVRSNMVEVYKYWIAQAGFDGFRIDTVKHVEMGFWQYWCPLVHAFAATNGKPNFFMFGEVYDGSDSKCGSYTGTQSGGAFALDSVLDYPLYFKINSVFANASGNTKQLEDRYTAIPGNYDSSAQMRLVTFLDNHDQARFLSVSGAYAARLQVALAFLYTSRGIPCLYYGTEQGFNGATDPNDREDMFDGQFEQGPSLGDNFNMTNPLFQWVAKLTNFRRLYSPLKTGSQVNKWSEAAGPGLFAYARRLGTQEVFVVLNTAASAQTLTNRSTILAPGTKIVNLFDTNEVLTVTATAEIPPISMPGTGAKIFVAQTLWQPLDPTIVSNSPAHDASSVPTWSPVVLQFSEPMDTSSVQVAFGTVPSMSGAFSWSASRDLMTFIPSGVGLPGLSSVTVRLTNSAVSALSGRPLLASFEMRFKTAATSIQDTQAPTVSIEWPTNGAILAGNLNISGAAADNIAVQRVELRLDTNTWVQVSGTSAWGHSLNTSNLLNGTHVLSARAIDTASNISTTNSVSVRFINVPGSYLQRLSAGNPANVTDCAANVWLADRGYSFGSFGYSGGTTGYVANTISNMCAAAQTLYQRERYSTATNGFRFWFDCPIGIYETTLLETDTWVNNTNQRLFNLLIENQQVLTNFDIFAAAGGKNRPLTRVFTNAVLDGQLELVFLPVLDNARASGIQVRKIGDLMSDSDGIPDWWRLAWFDHALGSAADLSRASDDRDGDGASNLAEFLAGTDPLNSASVFKIAGLLPAGDQFQVLWPTRTNKTYQLQGLDSLVPWTDWTNFGPPVMGTDTLVTQSISRTNRLSQLLRIRAQ